MQPSKASTGAPRRAPGILAAVMCSGLCACMSTPEHGASRTTRIEEVDSSGRYRMTFEGFSYVPGSTIVVEQRQTNGLMTQVGIGTTSATAVPDTTPPLYTWSVNANTIRGPYFNSNPVDVYNPNQPWPFGGVGAFRAIQYNTIFSPPQLLGSSLIDVQTGEVQANQQTLSGIADVRTSQLGGFIDPGLEQFRDPFQAIANQRSDDFLSRRVSPEGAGNSYRTVRHTTIPGSLLDFNNSYQKPEDPIIAAYFNDGDLGFGRRMECWLRFGANLASWDFVCGVGNYVDADEHVEGAVNAQHALDRSGADYVATVAMIWSSYPASGPERQARFAVYPASGNYSGVAALDGGGAKEVPGLCINCHGGKFTDNTNSDVSNSVFLPFDVASFKFPTSTGLTPALEESFRTLNYWVGVIAAIDGRLPLVDLVNGWYNHDGRTIASVGQTFSAAYTPLGWASPKQAQLYHQLVAPYCRTCHIALDGVGGTVNLTWNTALEFTTYPTLRSVVCAAGIPTVRMPHAQRTFQNFWKNGTSAFMAVDYQDLGGAAGPNCVFKRFTP